MADADDGKGALPTVSLDPKANQDARERLRQDEALRDRDAPDSHSRVDPDRAARAEGEGADQASNAGWANRPAG